jgi:hypothetical protein
MIKGIDTQIMVARTTDVARDASQMAKFGDVAQDNKALKAQLDAVREQQQVQKEEESDRADMRPDEDGSAGAEYEASGGKSGGGSENLEHDDMPAPGTFVPRSMNRIDITV